VIVAEGCSRCRFSCFSCTFSRSCLSFVLFVCLDCNRCWGLRNGIVVLLLKSLVKEMNFVFCVIEIVNHFSTFVFFLALYVIYRLTVMDVYLLRPYVL